MPALVDTSMYVLLLLISLSSIKAILVFFEFMGDGVGVNNKHVVDTVRPLSPEVSD